MGMQNLLSRYNDYWSPKAVLILLYKIHNCSAKRKIGIVCQADKGAIRTSNPWFRKALVTHSFKFGNCMLIWLLSFTCFFKHN